MTIQRSAAEAIAALVIKAKHLFNEQGVEERTNVDTTRHVVKAFGKTADAIVAELRKDKVLVAGNIVTHEWSDKTTGENRYKAVVLADAVGKSLG